MNVNKSWNSIGEEIRCAVEDALRTGDFRDLGDTFSNTVKDVKVKVEKTVSNGKKETQNYTAKWEEATRARKRAKAQQEQAEKEKAVAVQKVRAPFVKKGSVSGILYQVFGGIGTGITSILSAISAGLLMGGGGNIAKGLAVSSLILLGGSVTMLWSGIRKRRCLKRALKYWELAGHNHYINIEDLALHTGKKKQFVRKDLRKMLDAGFYPEGHLDKQESCLMLDDNIYREYLNLEKQRKAQEKEQKANALKEAMRPKKDEQTVELENMIAEGQACIKKLREMNDNIAGEEISAKLFKLENLSKEIFEGVKEHPEQMPQMQKFMNYYLPTTLKLVGAYEEFDEVSAPGAEIKEAKQEIEKTLDSINSAFEELLNRMFRSTAYDVTTDAQVLQTMLAKEGLTRQREFETVRR